MDLTTLCLSSVAGHVQALDIECGEASGNVLPVPGLAMEFLAHDIKHDDSGLGWHRVTVTFEARPEEATSPGVKVLTIGIGSDAETAAVDAGHQWSVGVVPVLASELLPEREFPGIEKVRMIIQGDTDAEGPYGWIVHLGEVIVRVFGQPGTTTEPGDLSRQAAFKAIFETVHPYAHHSNLMWIESFAMRYPDARVDATCRLNNNDWMPGKKALMAWASSWPDTQGFVISKRQFTVWEPVKADQLPPEIIQKLHEETKRDRPWWKRILG